VTATDASGTPVTGIAIAATASDTSVAKVCGLSSSQVAVCASSSNGSGRPGRAVIIASTTTYGVTVADTVPVDVTPPLWAPVLIKLQELSAGGASVLSFVPSAITVAPGGTVTWINWRLQGSTGQPVDVTFDDSSNVSAPDTTGIVNCRLLNFPTPGGGSGNIPAFGDTTSTFQRTANMCRARRFNVPGTYLYQSVLTGARGTVVVTTGLTN